jgi:hypothetical protein
MSAVATAADMTRRQWGVAGDGDNDNGCIGQEAPLMVETTKNKVPDEVIPGNSIAWGNSRAQSGGGARGGGTWGGGIGSGVVGRRRARAYGCNLMNSRAVSNKLCLLCVGLLEFNSWGITIWTEREKNNNLVHNNVTSIT